MLLTVGTEIYLVLEIHYVSYLRIGKNTIISNCEFIYSIENILTPYTIWIFLILFSYFVIKLPKYPADIYFVKYRIDLQ